MRHDESGQKWIFIANSNEPHTSINLCIASLHSHSFQGIGYTHMYISSWVYNCLFINIYICTSI